MSPATLDAIERVYRQRYGNFRNALATITGSQELAREATQEAFAKAVAQRDSFRGKSSVETWIWRIAIRTALDVRRSEATAPDATDLMTIEVAFVEPERDPHLAAAVRMLPPRRRLMLFLRFFADLSYREIAEVCDVSEGTVAASLAQARAELSKQLRPEEVPG